MSGDIREQIEQTPELDKAVQSLKLLLAKQISKRFTTSGKKEEEKKVVMRKTSTCYILQDKSEMQKAKPAAAF
jgi:hypothetical protein